MSNPEITSNTLQNTGRPLNRLGRFVEGVHFQRFIVGLILLNAVTMGLETVQSLPDGLRAVLKILDTLILGVFVFEIGSKLIYRRWGFFRDGWNIFDFLVVAVALVPASGPLAVLRTLRVLRLLRLLSAVPHLRRVVDALLSALPGIGTVAGIIALIFYVGAVLSTNLFGGSFPDWFGTLGRSMYTLFQIMTLESWSMGIVRPVMEVYPVAWAFFVPFIAITSFAVLNLLIGIIVNAMNTVHEHELHAAGKLTAEESGTIQLEELRALRRELADMKALLEGDANKR